MELKPPNSHTSESTPPVVMNLTGHLPKPPGGLEVPADVEAHLALIEQSLPHGV